MTADARFDRDLTALLEDLYLGPSPDYSSEAVTSATQRRQRASWTFPGRWLPMADIVGTAPVVAPPVRWRTLGLAVLLIALLIAAAAVVAASRQARVPLPFGPARNGVIAYPSNGDIYALDPVTGRVTALVTGDPGDLDPAFSPDGTKVAFSRLSGDGRQLTIFVADADGSHARAITPVPLTSDGLRFEWGPDSRSVLVQTASNQVLELDATEAHPPQTLATGAELYVGAARPPDGRQLLLKRPMGQQTEMVARDMASGRETILATGGQGDFGTARWSPDGTQIVYSATPTTDPESRRLWIMNADGTGAHQITTSPGTWFEVDQSWSPDGKRIAFSRWQQTSPTTPAVWEVRQLAVYDVATGTVTAVGPTAHDVRTAHPTDHDGSASVGEGWAFEWSPDGASLLALPSEASGHPVLIDPSTGTFDVLDTIVDEQGIAAQVWQRQAP